MTQAQGQTQDAQNAQQREYPASAESGYNETQGGASGDDTQTDQLPLLQHVLRQPRLADAAGAGDRDQAVAVEQARERGQVVLAADQLRQPLRQRIAQLQIRGRLPWSH